MPNTSLGAVFAVPHGQVSAQQPFFLLLAPGRLFVLRKRKREQKLCLPKGLVGQVSLRPESRPRLAWLAPGGLGRWSQALAGHQLGGFWLG